MKTTQLPQLTKETLTILFENTAVSRFSEIERPFKDTKMRSFHRMIRSMQYFNLTHRYDDSLSIQDCFPPLYPFGYNPNTEKVFSLFALGLALKELYQLDEEEFKRLLTQSGLF